MYRVEGKMWECSVCSYNGQKCHVFEHIEAKHVDHPAYSCGVCGTLCSTKNSLRQHKYRNHKGTKT